MRNIRYEHARLKAVASLVLLSALGLLHSSLFAQGTAFTYQGLLQVNGSPVTGPYDLNLAMFNVPNGAGQIGTRQKLSGHVPEAAKRLRPAGYLPASKRLDLALGLPLRNKEAVGTLLQQIYDPGSPSFHRYLMPQEFTEMFGPTEQDYQALLSFANSNGFTITATHPNRTLLDVNATVEAIEKALHLSMRVYQHPTESRTFFAPDVEPSLDLGVPVLHISGLDDYSPPRPNSRLEPVDKTAKPKPNVGSGPGGAYMGNDFRAAYAPGVALNGSGQSVGLVQFDGYYASDIADYEASNGIPNVQLVNVLLNGVTGVPSNNSDPSQNGGGPLEVSLDIEAVIAMAPGISSVYVYQGTQLASIVNRMATDNLSRQLSSSWNQGDSYNASAEQAFQQMAAQGQSFFCASGDDGARTGAAAAPEDSTNITIVGGTVLSTTGPGGSRVSETAWNGSGGGVSYTFAIPSWQVGVNIAANQGSATMRMVPDVALTASGVFVIANRRNSFGPVGGTSAASPLWAGFCALINQQAAAVAKPPVGFLNPLLYELGKSGSYASAFNDITTGNNTSSSSPGRWFAVPGYDLCTGWGTPNGVSTINTLVTFSGTQIQQMVAEPADGSSYNEIHEFDLYNPGLFWWSGGNTCAGEFASFTRIGLLGHASFPPPPPHYLMQDCIPRPAFVVRDYAYVYYTDNNTGRLYKKAITAQPGDPPTEIPTPATPLTSGFQFGAMMSWNGRLYWTDNNANELRVHSINPDGTSPRDDLVAGVLGGNIVKRIIGFSYHSSSFAYVDAMFILTTSGKLYRWDTNPQAFDLVQVDTGVLDFALRNEVVKSGAFFSAFTSLYAAKGVNNGACASIASGSLVRLDAGTDGGGETLLYQASNQYQVTSVEADNNYLFFTEQGLTGFGANCSVAADPSNIRRQFRPSTNPGNNGWELLVSSASGDPSGPNLRSDGLWLYFMRHNVISRVPTGTSAITKVAKVGGDLQLSFTTQANHTYNVLGTSDVNSGNWSTVLSGIPGTGRTVQATIPNAFGQPRQFLRIQQTQ
jgi:hypothetical protein